MANPATDLTSNMSSKFSNTAKTMDKGLQAATGSLEDISRTVGARAGEVANQVGDYYESSRKYVEHNPMKGVAIAATTGLVLGSLLTMAFRTSSK